MGSGVTCNLSGMSVNDRVKAHRQRMKEQGFRMVHIWVPDVHSAEFARAAHEQSLLAAEFDKADDTQDWIDAINAENWDDE
jgi:Protein  of unknown function (DUF3018)